MKGETNAGRSDQIESGNGSEEGEVRRVQLPRTLNLKDHRLAVVLVHLLHKGVCFVTNAENRLLNGNVDIFILHKLTCVVTNTLRRICDLTTVIASYDTEHL
jgi:hypothetical protein